MFTSTAFKNPDTANQQFSAYVQLLGSEQGWPSSAVQALLILSQQELEAAKAWWRSEQEEADLYWRGISQKALPTLDAVIDTSELPKIESFASLVGAAQTTAQAELEESGLRGAAKALGEQVEEQSKATSSDLDKLKTAAPVILTAAGLLYVWRVTR